MDTVEGDTNGVEIDNRVLEYGTTDTIINQILTWKDLELNLRENSTASENVSILSNDFYMHDGQNLFDKASSTWSTSVCALLYSTNSFCLIISTNQLFPKINLHPPFCCNTYCDKVHSPAISSIPKTIFFSNTIDHA